MFIISPDLLPLQYYLNSTTPDLQSPPKPPHDINKHLHKPIKNLCPFSLGKKNELNHCAYFVSHVMGYELPGVTCKNYTYADKKKEGKGATIRVDDIFKKSPETGLLADKPVVLCECLIFVTVSSNVRQVGNQLMMGSHRCKHIGILHKGKVWNYSNSHDMVVADLLEVFKSKFSSAYKKCGTVEFYYGKFL